MNYESVTVGTWTTGTSVSANKPTGLAVGDLMIAHRVHTATAAETTSGWTNIGDQNDGAAIFRSNILVKIADSSDVAASTFTFTTASSTRQNVSIARISGASAGFSYYVYGEGSTTNTSTPSIGAGITPDSRYTNMLMQFWVASTGASTQISGYAIATSNPTWTEINDSYDSSDDVRMASAYGIRPQTTATGNVSCSGGSGTTDWAVQILCIISIETTFTESVTLTEVLRNNLVDNTIESVSLTETVTTQKERLWNNETKPNSTWTNEIL